MVTPETTPDIYRNVKPGTYEEVSKRAKVVKDKYRELFWRQPNVRGVGIGLIMGEGGIYTGEVGIVVTVTEKVPDEFLTPADRIPPMLEGVLVQIVEQPYGEFIR